MYWTRTHPGSLYRNSSYYSRWMTLPDGSKLDCGDELIHRETGGIIRFMYVYQKEKDNIHDWYLSFKGGNQYLIVSIDDLKELQRIYTRNLDPLRFVTEV